MTCPSCGAESQGKFCEYCGSEMPQEKSTVNITNNYYGGTAPQEQTEVDNNVGKCPKCGNSKITFKRERVGTATQSRSRKNYIGTGRQGQSVSQSAYRTVGVCQSCGYTWNPNATNKGSGKKTWLWVLGWICIFPLPLTILLLRKKNMKPALKYGIIAAAWVLYLIIALAGNSSDNSGADTRASTQTGAVSSNITGLSFTRTDNVTLKVGESYSSGYIKANVRGSDFSSDDVLFVSDNPDVATISLTKVSLSTYLYYEIVAIGPGETSVYVTSLDGSVVSEMINITVPEPIRVESITINDIGSELVLGDSVTLSLVIYPENAEDKSITWSSSDETVLQVDEKGNVHAIGGGTATITASTNNGVASTIELNVDGSKRNMSLQVTHPRQDDVNIGDEWSYITEINRERTSGSYTVSVGDTLQFYAKFTESDDNPDVGEASASYTVTEEDLINGFTVSMDLYVTENGGRNSGKSAHFLVTFTFTPK